MAMIAAVRVHRLWRTLPIGTLTDVIGAGTCLILAPHPDDESLGCGGLIAQCCAESRPPVVAILTDGSGSHPGSQLYPPAKLAALRQHEATRAVQILGLRHDRLFSLHAPDTNAPRAGPAFDAIVQYLSELVRTFDCSAILATWRFDPHCDHAAAALLASAAARITGIPHRSYPVWGWTLPDDTPVDAGPIQGWRLDVTAHLAAKRRAIAAHASQYGGLISDDPGGFQLPAALLLELDGPWETFILP
jgi:LmbE family N-acetylglucosaminyl deacetylase